jgi:DNA-binding NarL/FixJ family response regulator
MAPPIRLIVADEHPLVREGIAELLRLEPDLRVVALCRDAGELATALREAGHDVLLLDSALAAQLEAAPRPPVLWLAAGPDRVDVLAALRAGARGIVVKGAAPTHLASAVRRVHAGALWLEQGLGERGLHRVLGRVAGGR